MKVLLIDDDLISRMALTDALRPLRHLSLVEAESADQAWQLLSTGVHPALCCCDVRMPGMTGIELLERMRAHARLRSVPVLLVSSASDRQTVSGGIMLGAGGFIVKPFQAADLRAKVKTLLGTNLETLFEPQVEACKRLGLTAGRYSAYMEALALKIGNAEGAMRTAGAYDAATLDALHTGCLTLGAHYCAGVVDGLKGQLNSPFNASLLDELGDIAHLLRDRAAAVLVVWR